MITRMMTESERAAITAALPARLKPIMDEIEYCKEWCWSCEHYEGWQGGPGTCKLHGCEIPSDERNKKHDCWTQMIVPF